MSILNAAGIKSLYVHIPFCRSKCTYCDFLSFPLQEEGELSRYLDSLVREMALYCGLEPQTLYIGGGTPSMLSPKQFSFLHNGLRRHFKLNSVEEFSIEANPDTVDEERLEAWLRAGINRISLGVQSFDDAVLMAVDRKASEADILHAVKLFQEAGMDNFSIDLILGLQPSYQSVDPESVFNLFKGDLHKAVSLQPTHISVYMLHIAEETALGRMMSGCSASVLDDATLEEMYLFAVEFLEEHGYAQYELSNFATPGKESMHNIHYWQGKDYIGLGLGAASTVGCRRTRNSEDRQKYSTLIQADKNPFEHEELLTREILLTERIMLSLRMTTGLNIDALMPDASEGSADRLQAYLNSLLEHRIAMRRGSQIVLTAKGLLRSNAVIADIVRLTVAAKNRHS